MRRELTTLAWVFQQDGASPHTADINIDQHRLFTAQVPRVRLQLDCDAMARAESGS